MYKIINFSVFFLVGTDIMPNFQTLTSEVHHAYDSSKLPQ